MPEIFVVHPAQNLVKTVAEDLLKRGHLSEALVIFPHRRPVAYLEYYLAQMIEAPCLLPRLKAFEDWVAETYVSLEDEPREVLSDFDQAWLAYLAAREVFQEEGEDLKPWEEFFPWALRLAKLFEELDLELKEGKDLYHPPEEFLPEGAARLLERLGRIYEAFNRRLEEGRFVTPAKRIRFLAEEDFPLPQGPVYLVGFYALTGAEDRLFRKLYEAGAYIYWQADGENLPELYDRWRQNWRVKLKEIRPEKVHEPELFFFEAHDLHSELKALKQRLPSKIDPRPDRCAVVLLSTGSLIPLIHHLPEGPVNLTMGYPLRLTGLFTFLESLISLILRQDKERGYRLSDLLEFLKSPYLKVKRDLEARLREFGAPFITRERLLELVKEDPKLSAYLKDLFEEVVGPLEEARTPRELSQALRRVFGFLKPEKNFGAFEQGFLSAMLETVLPGLETSLFSRERMERRGLFRLLEEMISSVRVPFEGEPLCGLQVMGLLETRLLSFEEVFFLDLNEGVLPDVEEVNPLVPHEVRMALGLPDRERDEAILRYHFERLLGTAKKAHLLWQFQTTRSGEAGLEGKKIRSRYVEKLIWKIEKQEGKPFSESKEAHRLEKSFLEILPEGLSRPEPLRKDENFKEAIKECLAKVSPSLLEHYLKCPLSFFYARVLRLRAPGVPEEMDHAQLGEAVHRALHEFFEDAAGPNLPAEVRKEDLKFRKLSKFFKKALKEQDFYRHLSEERKFFLLEGAEFRLRKYLENHPEETTIFALEKTYTLPFTVRDLGEIELTGRIDRVDQRGDVYLVLDYKTGWIKDLKAKKVLGLNASSWLEEERFDDEALREILELLPDLQLPFYAYLFVKDRLNQGESEALWEKVTAAYVELYKKGEEKYLFAPKEIGASSASWLRDKFPELLTYLITHILKAPYWYPAPDESACKYCDYSKMCRYGG